MFGLKKVTVLHREKEALSRRAARWSLRDELSFVVTNRIPRVLVTCAMGMVSRWRGRRWTWLALRIWRLFGGPDLADAVRTEFDSIHDCFTRALRPGTRPIAPDPGALVSPCDGIVMACGHGDDETIWQAKGLTYTLGDLFGPTQDTRVFRDGTFVTLRLTASMYHRFHSPCDATLDQATYIRGDVWNVNPPTVARVPQLYCRNERVVIRLRTTDGDRSVALVAVAAILVASIRLHVADVLLHLRHDGPNEIDCGGHQVSRGDELGWFEHGSTIIVFAPAGFCLAQAIAPGARVRMGQALLRFPGQEPVEPAGSNAEQSSEAD